MNTTISIPTAEYDRARTFAKEQNLSLDELFAVLIGQLTLKEEDAAWYSLDEPLIPYTYDELQARIDEGEAQFERTIDVRTARGTGCSAKGCVLPN